MSWEVPEGRHYPAQAARWWYGSTWGSGPERPATRSPEQGNDMSQIVILTTFGRPGFLRRAMESGVSAFLVKDSPADKLTQTIRRVLNGERVIDPDLAAAALADGGSPLTPRERDVLGASPAGGPSPRSPPTSTSPRARCGTTCPCASRRPGPGTAPRRSTLPPSMAGFRP